MRSGARTRIGGVFDRHPLLLRGLAIGALLWGLAYLTWRIGWSGEGASPVAFAMLPWTGLWTWRPGRASCSTSPTPPAVPAAA